MIVKLLTLSHVPRWSIIDTLKPQSVGEHCHRVAAITLTLVAVLDKFKYPISKSKALELAIIHDVEESVSGDIPTPYKRKLGMNTKNDDLKSLEAHIVKVADIMEAIIFLSRYGLRSGRITEELKKDLDTLYWNIIQFDSPTYVAVNTHIIRETLWDVIQVTINEGIDHE